MAKYNCTSVKNAQTKWRMSKAQMEKKTQRDSDRINQFQQKKLVERLAIGMAVRNATLKQLGHKVKEEEIITFSAKAAGEEAAAWAAKCAEQKQQYPSHTLCYVHCDIRHPSRSKLLLLSKFNSKRIMPSATVMWSSCAL